MKDGIIKGTGNSRYLKSVPNALSLYPTYASLINALVAGNFPIDLNGLNLGGWNDPGTPLNKATFLKDDTAAIYGLGEDAVPDDVFAWLGKYNQYWWRRYPIEKGAATELLLIFISSSSGIGKISYSSTFKISPSGEVSLENPSTLSLPYASAASAMNALSGSYIQPSVVSGIYYYYGSPRKEIKNGNAYFYGSVGPANLGVPEFIHSSSPTAYPDGYTQGNYLYELVGKPFGIVPGMAQIAAFGYQGTGTLGINAPTILSFPFRPKLVIVTSGAFRPDDGYWRGGFLWEVGVTSTSVLAEGYTVANGGSISATLLFNLSGNNLEFYSSNTTASASAADQFNAFLRRYHVVAFG